MDMIHHQFNPYNMDLYVPCEEADIKHLRDFEAHLEDNMNYQDLIALYSMPGYASDTFINITLPALQKCIMAHDILTHRQEVEEKYDRYFKEHLEYAHGNVILREVKKELIDYMRLMDNASKVYCHITNNTLSKTNYDAATVIRVADEYISEASRVHAHSEYDFVNNDKVFCKNSDNTRSFFILQYVEDVGAWMLLPFTDKTFVEPLANKKGKIKAEYLYEYGWDMIERCEDYDYDDL